MFIQRLASSVINKEASVLYTKRFYSVSENTSQLAKTGDHGNYQLMDVKSLPNADSVDEIQTKEDKVSVLEDCKEDISHVAPYLKPTFNFAAYVNKSETLQQLVKLGVNLHKIEKSVEAAPFILKLDFEKDIKNYIQFFHDHGVSLEGIAEIITRNPFILKENLGDLEVRINYLESKRFHNEMIARIVSSNPYWLSFSTQQIDERLGFFQKHFKLSGHEVRQLAAKRPKLISSDLKGVKLNTFVIKEEMGFNDEEIKKMILNKPAILAKSQKHMLKSFEYVHKDMEIPIDKIVEFPEVLTCREFRIKQRHLFLKSLNRIQFDPKQPLYISLRDIISGTDAHFSTEVAKSSVQAFNAFLKTL